MTFGLKQETTEQLRNTKKTNNFENVLPKSNQLLLADTRRWSVSGFVVIPCGCSTWPITTAQTSPFPALTFPSRLPLPPSSLKRNENPFLMKLLLPKTSSPVTPLPFSALGDQPSLSFAFCPAPSTIQASPSIRTHSCQFLQQPPKPSSSRAAQQLRKGNTSDIRDLLSPQDLQTDRIAEETPPEPAAHRHWPRGGWPAHSCLWSCLSRAPGKELIHVIPCISLASWFGFYFSGQRIKAHSCIPNL